MLFKRTEKLLKHLDRLVKANYGFVEIHGEPGQHKILDIEDAGISVNDPGGGNVYHLEHAKTGKKIKVHQSKIKDIVFKKAEKDQYCEGRDKLIAEHKRLINKLKSKSSERRAEEVKIQEKELKEMMKSYDDMALEQYIKAKYAEKKPPTDENKIKHIKAKHAEKKPATDEEKIRDIKAANYNMFKHHNSNQWSLKKSENTYSAEALSIAMMKTIDSVYGKLNVSKNTKQPTDEELFGHLLISESMEKAAQHAWDNTMTGWLIEANRPISSRFSSKDEELDYWRSIQVFSRDGEE